MPLGALYELKGARELTEALHTVSELARARAGSACQETARLITRSARAAAPRDRGDLQASISFEGRGLSWRVGIADVTIPSRGGTNSAHLNPWVYGVWYEYGFVTRGIETRPFMRTSADAQEGPHLARMEAAINNAVGAVA